MHEMGSFLRLFRSVRHCRPLIRRVITSVSLAFLLVSPHAHAQLGTEIGEQALTAPWLAHLAALGAAQGTAARVLDATARERRIDRLTLAQVTIGEFEAQVDEVIERIGFDTQFGYVATDTSLALSRKLLEIAEAFDALYADLGLRDGGDVRRAQSQLRELAAVLEKKTAFERDVVNALGSGVRQSRVDLATRWWKGEEAAAEVAKLLAQWREQLQK